ncbi:AAA family ATPase [Clostridium sp. D2Q-11]|uniref:AAA family ATPase n=1 Tax=Anaeromonas frigoriresistens TaxID=2683708 RepID=A0A942UQF7_9FIRM|nr:ATP-binding protein [Anaeromonas frigoriresistens]MBS4537303.1 AAA family ATPase [Anaeromonas frigoriresistens]
MKNILFLCGPNGIGKTTICKEIINQLPNSAYVDSDPCRIMNPFVLNDDTIPTIAKNISDLLINYLKCPIVNTVVFSYGFHGRRREVFQRVLSEVSKIEHNLIPFLLWCSEEENISRMNVDNRSNDRIQRALNESRKSFDDVIYPKLDITSLSVSEAAKTIIKEAIL